MQETIFYWLSNHQIETFDKFDELNNLFSTIGVSIEIKQYENAKGIQFNYDPQELKRMLKRNAGRKKVSCMMSITVEDVRERMNKGESAESIASELGISRSTLFRKLKYAEEHDIMFLE